MKRMPLIIRNRKMTRRVFAHRGSLVVAGSMLTPFPLAAMESPPGGRLAMYQEESARGIVCRICPNECTLKEGELSDCHNRVVRKSKLYTMAYGNPCAVNPDPVEKKPLYHFLPIQISLFLGQTKVNLKGVQCQEHLWVS